MNVLFLDQSSDAGGGQRCLAEIVDESVRRGWRTTVGLPGPGFLMKTVLDTGASVVTLPCGPYRSGTKAARDYFRFGADLLRQYSRISSLVRTHDSDLVYVNGPRLLPAAVAARQDAPLLFHAHSVPAQSIALRLARIAAAHATTVVCCCDFVAKVYGTTVPASKIRVVRNGVPDMGFRQRRVDGEALRVGVIGRIEPAKGQLLAVEALRLMTSSTLLQLWGNTEHADARYLTAIQRAAHGLRVVIPGEMDTVRILQDLDLLIVPSLAEGSPRVILEAFSAGVPVLAFPAGGIPEVVRDGETGFLVQECSAAGIADAVQRIRSLPVPDRERITRNARAQWEQEYRADLFRARLAQLMQETVRLVDRGDKRLLLPQHRA